MALVLVLCRLCDPSSELHIAEHFYAQSALADLLGIPPEKINEQRLYRALDALLAAQGSVGRLLEESAGRAVRPGVRPAAVRRDQHVLRGPGRGQSAGPARLLARPSAGLQAGLHRPGGLQVRDAAGLRGVRGKSHGRDDAPGDRRDDGAALRPGGSDLGGRPRHGLGREHRLPQAERTALHRGHAQEHAQAVRAGTARRRLAHDPRRAGSEALSVAGRRRRPSCSAAAAIAARKKRPCTAASSSGSKKDCRRIEASCQKQRLEAGRRRPARGPA